MNQASFYKKILLCFLICSQLFLVSCQSRKSTIDFSKQNREKPIETTEKTENTSETFQEPEQTNTSVYTLPARSDQIEVTVSETSILESEQLKNTKISKTELPENTEIKETEILESESSSSDQTNVQAPVSDSIKNIIDTYIAEYPGIMYVSFKNLTSGQEYIYSEEAVYAASLSKLFMMGTVYDAIENGIIEYSPAVEQYLEIMITISDNNAYNQFVFMLQEAIPDRNVFLLLDEFCAKYGFSDTIIHNLLQLPGDSYYRYPTDHVLVTSARDVGRFLDLVYRGEMINPEVSEEMLGRLRRQQRLGKIPALLPADAVTANKTGERDYYSHDSAIIVSPKADYVLVVMTDAAPAGVMGDGYIQSLSLDIYNELNK